MDLDIAKENIQPLAGGRNIRYLEAALNASSIQDLNKQRQEHEDDINNYEGDDPLAPWFEYILWIEQSYPSGGKESGLEEVLLKCLTTFESDTRYHQDRRMIKLYIKYIDSQPSPQEFYQELYNQGIGTMVADLYICWAYYYELCGNFKKADSIFRKGLDARAQPFDEIDQAHKHFGFTMSQRILYPEETSQEEFILSLRERRHALTSLKHHKKKVGSIRTGSAVKNYNPGKVQADPGRPGTSRNVAVSVLEDENKDPNPIPPPVINETLSEGSHSQSVIKSIIDSARKKENLREPGPWSKAKMHNQKKGGLFGPSGSNSTNLGFEILEDEEYVDTPIPYPQDQNNCDRGIQLPKNHVSTNLPQKIWTLPLVLETEILPNTCPVYEKFHLYPKPGHEYSLEEFTAYKWLKKRNITNELTQRQDPLWGNEYSVGIRLYPNFAKTNLPGEELDVKRFLPEETILSGQCRLEVKVSEIYPEDSCYEYQFEEIMCEKWKKGKRKLRYNCNETIIMAEEMDETKIIVDAYGRKSIFPSRKSIAAGMYARKSIDKRQTMLKDTEKDGNEVYIRKQQAGLDETTSELKKSPVLTRQPYLNDMAKEINETLSNKPQVSFSGKDKSVNESLLLRQQTILSDTEKEVNQILAESNNSFRRSVIMTNPLKEDLSTKKEDNLIPCKSLQIECDEAAAETVTPAIKQLDNNKKKSANEDCDNFAIYEDDDFAFKAPPPPRQSKFQIYEEEENETTCSTLFAANETCSTQTFNFFIKSQSVSTPKNIKKNTSYFNHPTTSSAPQLVGVQQQQEQQFIPAILSPSETELALQAKQLSTIMEMTETPTGSSGTTGSTRLMDSQAHSPETDEDASNIQQISKACSGVSPDYGVPLKIAAPIKSIQEKEQKEETIPNMMMSLKLFEEKTETIPKVMLAPQQHIDSDFYSIFVKTPEKKATKTDVEFAVNDSMTFSNIKELAFPVIGELNKIQTVQKSSGLSKDLNESIVPGFEDFDLRTKKKQETDSPKAGKSEISSEVKLSFLESSINNKQPELPLLARFTKQNSIISSTESDTKNDSLAISEARLDKSYKDQAPSSHIPIFTGLSRISRGPVTLSAQSSKMSLMPKECKDKSFVGSSKKSTVSNEPLLDLELSTNKLNKSEHSTQKERTWIFEQSNVSEKTSPANKLVVAESTSRKSVRNNDFFEDNIRTDAFTPNISGIKNSTWLPNYQPKTSFLQEQSVHIKSEKSDTIEEEAASTSRRNSDAETSILNVFSKISKRQMIAPEVAQNDLSISFTEDECNQHLQMKNRSHPSIRKSVEVVNPPDHFPQPIGAVVKNDISEENNTTKDDLGRSIYLMKTPKTPLVRRHYWNDDDEEENNIRTVDLDRTRQVIYEHLIDINVNPFDSELIRAFLEKIDFCNYLEDLPNCNFVDKINSLKKHDVITINSKKFEITKMIGEGSYGTILCGKDTGTGKIYALKQEKPANLWEYYICLELKSRLRNQDILHGFMDIEYALIGNNASVLISEFSKYGSLITVCNKVKRRTGKNLDEYIVMILTSQMLSILDHLHASNIIHSDMKPDNILLMSKLNYDRKQLAVQLIDFGVSIDLALFPKGQKFTYVHSTLDFQCVEMREKRPWTFQTDLYGLAGIIHVLLFGKYMDLIKKPTGWTHTLTYPRYFNKGIWENIFHSLLNIIDCNAMPNLQNLKTLLDAEIVSKERLVRDKISEFNLSLE